MQFSVLSSGSKANCTFVEAGGTRILIDCGLSCRTMESRLSALGVDPSTLDAVLITHEHYDHVAGLKTLTKKYRLPLFASQGTASALSHLPRLERFGAGEQFWIGALQVGSFPINHDAKDPVGYTVRAEGLTFALATDLGRVTPIVEGAIRGAQALVLESNHDPELLQACSYSADLKKRIAGSHGHLSNDEAAQLLARITRPDLWFVVLAHLSENSNTPAHALATARAHVATESYQGFLCGSVAHATPLIQVDEGIRLEQAA